MHETPTADTPACRPPRALPYSEHRKGQFPAPSHSELKSKLRSWRTTPVLANALPTPKTETGIGVHVNSLDTRVKVPAWPMTLSPRDSPTSKREARFSRVPIDLSADKGLKRLYEVATILKISCPFAPGRALRFTV